MHALIFETASIVIGGAVLGIGGFSLKLMWDFREEWILDQRWRVEAQKTLAQHSDALETTINKVQRLENRVEYIERPNTYRLRTKRPNGIADDE